MLVSLTLMSVIMGGMTSAIVVATSAVPDRDGPGRNVWLSSEAVTRISSELRYSIHLAESEPTSVAFMIADRDGDGLQDRIRYAWSGTPGDPLTRQFNSQLSTVMLTSVEQLSFGYKLMSGEEHYMAPGEAMETPESVLHSFTDVTDAVGQRVRNSEWIGQIFTPTLPPEMSSWTVTKIRYRAKRRGPADGSGILELRTVVGGLPSDTVLADRAVSEPDLPSEFEWRDMVIRPNEQPEMFPGDSLAFTVRGTGGGAFASFQRAPTQTDIGNVGVSSDGSSWAATDGMMLLIEVEGTCACETAGEARSIVRTFITSVKTTIKTGPNQASRVTGRCDLLNAPEVLDGFWEADMLQDPLVLDVDGNLAADWRLTAAGSMGSSLNSGVWTPLNLVLETLDAGNLEQPVSIDVRVRDTSMNWQPAVVQARLENAAADIAVVTLLVDRTFGSQAVTLSATRSAGEESLAVVTAPTGSWVDVRMLIDQDARSILLHVNGDEIGAYRFDWVFGSTTPGVSMLAAGGASGAEFDSVRVRCGGASYVDQSGEGAAPVAVPSASTLETTVGAAVLFDATASFDPDGDPITFAWDFGDGWDASGSTVSHAFSSPGVRTVTLIVVDDGQAFGTEQLVVNVTAPEGTPEGLGQQQGMMQSMLQ